MPEINAEDCRLAFQERSGIEEDGKVPLSDVIEILRGLGFNPEDDAENEQNNDERVDEDGFMEIVAKQSEDPTEELREAFNKFDKDGNGTIDKDEFREILLGGQSNLNEEDVDELFKEIDTNDNGILDITELCKHLMNEEKGDKEGPQDGQIQDENQEEGDTREGDE